MTGRPVTLDARHISSEECLPWRDAVLAVYRGVLNPDDVDVVLVDLDPTDEAFMAWSIATTTSTPACADASADVGARHKQGDDA